MSEKGDDDIVGANGDDQDDDPNVVSEEGNWPQ